MAVDCRICGVGLVESAAVATVSVVAAMVVMLVPTVVLVKDCVVRVMVSALRRLQHCCQFVAVMPLMAVAFDGGDGVASILDFSANTTVYVFVRARACDSSGCGNSVV